MTDTLCCIDSLLSLCMAGVFYSLCGGWWPLYHSPSIGVREQLARVHYLCTVWILRVDLKGSVLAAALTHEAISPTIRFLYSRWRPDVGYSHKHPNIHIAAIKMDLWTSHIETPYAYYLPWNFILQISAPGTETKTVFIKLKDWKNWLSMQLCRIWGQEKDGLTHGLCHLPGVVLNLNLKALAFSP